MAALIAPPKIPPLPPTPAPPSVPTLDTARQNRTAMDLLAQRRGRAATILTGPQGDQSPVLTGAKQLLGS